MTRLIALAILAGETILVGLLIAAAPAISSAAAGQAGGVAMDPGDWPQWRGPNRDGVSTEAGLLDAWPAGGPPLLWKMTGCGNGLSAVVVLKGRFYIMGDRSQGATLQCYDLATQKLVWSRYVGPAWSRGEGPSPAIDGDALFGVIGVGMAYCVGLDGKLRWTRDFRKDFHGGLMNEQYGFSETPLVDGKQVIVNPGGPDACIAALDRDTGATIWKTSAVDIREATPGPFGSDKAGYSSAVIADGDYVRHYVHLVGRGLVGINPKDGHILWGYNGIAHGEANVPTPIVRDNYVYCTNGYGGGTCCLKLLPDGQGGVRAEKVWHISSDICENMEGQAAVVGDYFYTSHGKYAGIPMCLDLKTGKVMWKAPGQTGTGVSGMTAVDGKLIFRAEGGEVTLVEATPKKYNLISVFVPMVADKPNWSHPVVSHGLLFLRHEDTLMCYDLRKH